MVVLGDLNELEFASTVSDLETNAALTNLTNVVEPDERYTFIFQGNSQSLDHILVSDSLADQSEADIVNVNSELADTDACASDQDPILATLYIGQTGLSQTGTAASETLTGRSGKDTLIGLVGLDGNDLLNGGDGDDEVFGFLESDELRSGTGDDVLAGGAGETRSGSGRARTALGPARAMTRSWTAMSTTS